MKKLYRQKETIEFYHGRCHEKESRDISLRYLEHPKEEIKHLKSNTEIFEALNSIVGVAWKKQWITKKEYLYFYKYYCRNYFSELKEVTLKIEYGEVSEESLTFDELKEGLNLKEFREYLHDNNMDYRLNK